MLHPPPPLIALDRGLCLPPLFFAKMVKLDFMHAADLGVLTYLLGDVFWSLLLTLADGHAGQIGARRLAGLKNL